jgi:hypothetical protein
MVGLSLGGAAAAGAMAREPGCQATFSHHGWRRTYPRIRSVFGPIVPMPIRLVKWISVTGTDHLDFGDFGDWVDLLGLRSNVTMQTLGPIWSPRMNRIVSEYVLRLFDMALGQSRAQLDLPNPPFPEVLYVNGSTKMLGL